MIVGWTATLGFQKTYCTAGFFLLESDQKRCLPVGLFLRSTIIHTHRNGSWEENGSNIVYQRLAEFSLGVDNPYSYIYWYNVFTILIICFVLCGKFADEKNCVRVIIFPSQWYSFMLRNPNRVAAFFLSTSKKKVVLTCNYLRMHTGEVLHVRYVYSFSLRDTWLAAGASSPRRADSPNRCAVFFLGGGGGFSVIMRRKIEVSIKLPCHLCLPRPPPTLLGGVILQRN